MALIGAPPRDTPFFGKSGRISDVWLSWLQSITSAGAVVETLHTLSVVAEDNSTDANTAAILAEILDAIALGSEPRRAPDPAPDAADSVASFAALKAEVDELRALVAAGDPAPFGALGSAAFQTGVSGSFTSADGHTITVSSGVITSIV